MFRKLSVLIFIIALIPAAAMALPQTTSTGALLAQAESRGYNFEIDDRNDPNRIAGVLQQFDALCVDMFGSENAELPRMKVKNTSYMYLGFKVQSMTCTIELPSAD